VTHNIIINFNHLSYTKMPEKKDCDDLPPVPSQVGQVLEDQYYENDAVFGEITEEGPNYRSVRMT
jgi:hypothetical protein